MLIAINKKVTKNVRKSVSEVGVSEKIKNVSENRFLDTFLDTFLDAFLDTLFGCRLGCLFTTALPNVAMAMFSPTRREQARRRCSSRTSKARKRTIIKRKASEGQRQEQEDESQSQNKEKPRATIAQKSKMHHELSWALFLLTCVVFNNKC